MRRALASSHDRAVEEPGRKAPRGRASTRSCGGSTLADLPQAGPGTCRFRSHGRFGDARVVDHFRLLKRHVAGAMTNRRARRRGGRGGSRAGLAGDPWADATRTIPNTASKISRPEDAMVAEQPSRQGRFVPRRRWSTGKSPAMQRASSTPGPGPAKWNSWAQRRRFAAAAWRRPSSTTFRLVFNTRRLLTVRTQATNYRAVHLYEKAGFFLASTELIYRLSLRTYQENPT